MKPHPLFTCLAVAGLLCFASSLLHAGDRFWIDVTGGVFINIPNWSLTDGGAGGATAPGAADTANFTLNSTYTVSFSSSFTNQALDVDDGNVTFDLFGNTYITTSTLGIEIGTTSGQTGRLTVRNGILGVDSTGDDISIGLPSGSTGFLTVTSGGRVGDGVTRPEVYLGLSGTGTLTVNDNGQVDAQNLHVGQNATGSTTITGPNAVMSLSGTLDVGVSGSGSGTLSVLNGGTLSTSGSTDVGKLFGADGTVTVSGADSLWAANSATIIGHSGDGTLTISSSGLGSGTTATLGNTSTGIGTATVTGANSLWNLTGIQTVGSSGLGILTVSSGGRIASSSSATLGSVVGSEGRATVTGINSMWTLGGSFTNGSAGSGELTVSSGGEVSASSVILGSAATGLGTINITGAGSTLVTTGNLTVANLGSGTLNVASNADVFVGGTLLIGDPAGAPVGTLNFDGGWLTTVSFTRAAGGVFNWTDGTLTLINGPYNNASANLTINGGKAGDLPTLHLSGGSTGTGFGATTLTVGANHAGALQLTGFSTLSVATIVIGSADGGNGAVTVSGNFSSLTAVGSLAVGGTQLNPGGTGTLNINAGAAVTANDVHIWGGSTVNLDGGFLKTFTFTSDFGDFNFNSGTVHFTGATYTGGFGSTYDALLGFEHWLTAGKTIIYDGSFSFTGMNLIMEGGTLDVATALTVGFNSLLEMRSGTLTANTLANNAAGQVVLEGGSLTLLTTFSNPGDLRLAATTDFSLVSGTTLNNTGFIHGNGRIGMSLVNNSAGLVRVAAAERMVFTGASSNNGPARIEVSSGGDLQFQSSLANNSSIDVVGGTFRVQGVTTNAASTGRITGRDAFLRFDGGLVNNGSLAFSFGTSDIFGDITNSTGTGRIVVSGNSDATFYDDLVNNGAVQVSAGSTVVYFGAVSGPGSFPGGGTNFFEGDLSPGASPALIAFGGNVFFGTINQLTMEIGGPVRGTGYDALDIAGHLSLDGNLKVVLVNGFIPSLGQSFKLLNAGLLQGNFSSVTLPPLPAGRFWSTDSLATTGVLSVVGAPTLNYTNNGTNLGFSWSGAFKLQSQTNGLNVGISTNWGDYPGGGSSPVSVPIDVLRGSVFFRLSSP